MRIFTDISFYCGFAITFVLPLEGALLLDADSSYFFGRPRDLFNQRCNLGCSAFQACSPLLNDVSSVLVFLTLLVRFLVVR